MAIGDAISLYLGTASTIYQPSSGVEEQITGILKIGTTDNFSSYDGTNESRMIAAGEETHVAQQSATAMGGRWSNSAILITNSLYLRKPGTSDAHVITGVQTAV